MQTPSHWIDYELLATGNGEKLERWGEIILRRPEPQAIWDHPEHPLWETPNARFHRNTDGKNYWETFKPIPQNWNINYKDITFSISLLGQKQTGLFPEQALNWDWMRKKITEANRPINVLNLFAYTGGATIACAKAGASVCHVDSSKASVQRAKENAKLSGLVTHPIRYIVDDVIKFITREIKRGKKYDAIIMDPPSFGRGTKGEIWKFNKELENLIDLCSKILTKTPLFILINAYSEGTSPASIENILKEKNQKLKGGKTSSDSIGLKELSTSRILSCGIFGRWEN